MAQAEVTGPPLPGVDDGGDGRGTKLLKRLDLPDDATTCLVLDAASAAGLLGSTEAGYAPTGVYEAWREEDAADRWASLARAWFAMDHVPSVREVDGKEVPPPRTVDTVAGAVRRALLTAAGDGASVTAVSAHAGRLCPLAPEQGDAGRRVAGASLTEATTLGVVVNDALSVLGRRLVASRDEERPLAAAVSGLLADAPREVIVQSDLTAVVSGRLTAAAARLLTEAAEAGSRGTATTWRFTLRSVRGALDRGWNVDGLLAALRELSDRPLPQPLE